MASNITLKALEMVKCNSCFCLKNREDFVKSGNDKYLYRICKVCKKAYREKNKERFQKYHKKNYIKNRDKINQKHKNWYEKNKNKIEYKQRVALTKKKWTENNREKINLKKKELYHRRKKDPMYALCYRLRNRTRAAFLQLKFSKIKRWPEFIGCSPEELKTHIEKQFVDNMNWEKFYKGDIHIDHIIPLCTAKTEEDLYKLNHYSNLRPLWKLDNLKKGKKCLPL